jgi:predicted nucleic acid-binding Zn ribbon protein
MRRVAHVGEVLRSFLRGAHLEKELARRQTVLSWPRIVGAEVAAHSEALELRNQILWVAVPSSSWRQHILFLKPQILSAFRREHPGVAVGDIRCVTSARRRAQPERGERN